jgi:hypothetical protein
MRPEITDAEIKEAITDAGGSVEAVDYAIARELLDGNGHRAWRDWGDGFSTDFLRALINVRERTIREACAVAAIRHNYPQTTEEQARASVEYAKDPEGDAMPVIEFARAILAAGAGQ